MKRIHIYKRIVSTLLLLCMLLSCVEFTAFAAPLMRDGEVVKQGALVTSEDGMVTVQETAVHTSGNNFNVTMTVTTSDLVEIEPSGRPTSYCVSTAPTVWTASAAPTRKQP